MGPDLPLRDDLEGETAAQEGVNRPRVQGRVSGPGSQGRTSPEELFTIRMWPSAEPAPVARTLCWAGDQASAFTAAWCLMVCRGAG